MTTSEGTLRLHATFEPRGPAAAIVLTDEQVAALGGGKAPAVRVTANGNTVAARVARMGGENLLGFSKQLRADLGVGIGDALDVVIALDTAPREVELPPELVAALGEDAAARAAFDGLAPSHRKEFARWIDEAKRDETRRSRTAQALEMLRTGRTRR
ncbi:YdeI/OmpD-associated family protein [Jatrophihabitans sp.]|uniref:YdeI/OmpD-associated family protein n=1 Tax=Jatrophihabitans sp. TaxID=1932789 RepID=UPI002F1EDDBA